MYSLNEMESLKELLLSERANILLIGAMTICMPGAIECAKALPGLTNHSLFPKACREHGIAFDDLVIRLNNPQPSHMLVDK